MDYVIEKRDGQDMYVHKVEKGHTLYSIARLYKVDESSIIKANPEVTKGLSIDQTVYIPVPDGVDLDAWDNPIGQEGSFLLHKVKRGETLFGISQLYKVDVNQILEDNPHANSGLNRDQVLRVLLNDVDTVELVRPEPEAQDSLNRHVVKQGETLYSISRLYEVDLDRLQAVNNNFPEGLKAGSEIFIPGVSKLFAAQTQPIQFEIPVLNDVDPELGYNIALMLPLYLNISDTADLTRKQSILQSISLQFYRGVCASVDSLRLIGFNASLKVFDVRDTDYSVNKALEDEFMKNCHVIIGPLQFAPLSKVADYAVKRGIHVVCPVPHKNKILLNHPNLSKVVGSDVSQVDFLAKYVAREHFTDNVVLLNSMFTADARTTDMFRQAYQSAILSYPTGGEKQLIELKASGKSVGALHGILNPAVKNVIVMTSDNESLLQDMLTQLGLTSDEKYDIVVYGMESWLELPLIDAQYKERFHIALPSMTFADYQDPKVSEFVKNYYHDFKTDPGHFGLMGYDIMRYYGMGLLQYGLAFPNNFDRIEADGLLQVDFDYFKTGLESGYENRHFFMLEHRDYKLQYKRQDDASADSE
ncbi:MAG: LysM repeat protein [Flavobacteriales bacterium]|jgi:LysM repeat protein